MKFVEYLKSKELSLEQASQELGYSYEDVRRYSKNEVIPRPDRLLKISEWSGGEVTANDFINNYKGGCYES